MFEYYLKQRTPLPSIGTGWGNGYVKIPKGHWLFGLGCDDVDKWVNVHGGLTYSTKHGDFWV